MLDENVAQMTILAWSHQVGSRLNVLSYLNTVERHALTIVMVMMLLRKHHHAQLLLILRDKGEGLFK
ncbi:hypothetical protein FGO68_gene758 [Halteria grandinella]|uniref:Uncharacterized protein n=1 Tax=Halteria grandinella TaxID=5974 RepID=A0A8J8NW32_HALGN|nr:hypothetical protein FGO68_gene758 [Halteria grandinella]